MNEKTQNTDDVEIDIGKICLYLLKCWWIILICLVVGGVSGYLIGKSSVTYTYSSTYILYYRTTTDFGQQSQSQSGVYSLLSGCKLMATQSRFYRAVADDMQASDEYDLPQDFSFETVEDALSVEISSSSSAGNFIYLTVETRSTDLSYHIMQSVVKIFPDYIKSHYELASDESLTFSLANDIFYDDVEINSRATIFALLGGIGLALVSAIVLGVIYVVDSRVKDENELAETYNASILGAIPDFNNKQLMKKDYKSSSKEGN